MRLLLGVPRAAVLVDELLAVVQPAWVIGAWPCPLTPSTLRTLAVVLALHGTVGVTVALHPDAATVDPDRVQMIELAVVFLAVLHDKAGDRVGPRACAPVRRRHRQPARNRRRRSSCRKPDQVRTLTPVSP
jgi:hypothetical protein